MVEIGECVVLDGREYACFDQTNLDGKEYIYLTAVEEPAAICFAEVTTGDEPQIRVIGNRDEKQKLLEVLKNKLQPATE